MFWSQKFDPARDLADLTGKVIIVTGANTGIGYGTAKHLARKGAKVYLGSRSEEKGKKAVAQLKEEGIGSGKIIYFHCDLATPALAKQSADGFLQQENRLDVLGITEMMMVNQIGTFLFTKTLLPFLLKTSEEPGSDVRIVTVSSDGHRMLAAADPKIDFGSLEAFKDHQTKTRVPFFARYCVSKLANVLFSNALQGKLASSSIICVSLNPGFVHTSAGSRLPFPRLANFVISLLAMTPDDGALNSCFAAASPLVRQDAEKYKGVYLGPVGKIKKAADNALKVDLQDALWKTTEEYLESQGFQA
ncbi:hypothetical protein BDZ97DRAFT_1907144 [Flammula alnicola]|nr:hypothetical protein BDZ97DRAFT_1907144 [Flammula alnicola]